MPLKRMSVPEKLIYRQVTSKYSESDPQSIRNPRTPLSLANDLDNRFFYDYESSFIWMVSNGSLQRKFLDVELGLTGQYEWVINCHLSQVWSRHIARQSD